MAHLQSLRSELTVGEERKRLWASSTAQAEARVGLG